MNNGIYHMAVMAVEEKPILMANYIPTDDIAICCQNIVRKLSTQGGVKRQTIETQLRTYDVKVRNEEGLSRITIKDVTFAGMALSRKAWLDVSEPATYEDVSRLVSALDEAWVNLKKQEGGLS